MELVLNHNSPARNKSAQRAAHLASDGVVHSLGRSEYECPSRVIAEGVPERHGLCPTSGLSPRATPWSERSVRGNYSSPRADALDKPFGTADNDEQRWEGNAGKKTVYAARQQKTAGSAPGFAEKVKGGKIHKDQPSTAGDTGRRRGRAATPTRMDRSTTDVILPDPVDDPRRGLRLYLSPKVTPHGVHLNAPFGNDRNAPQRRREHRKAHHTAPFATDANKGAEDPIFTSGPLSSGSEHKPAALTPKARARKAEHKTIAPFVHDPNEPPAPSPRGKARPETPLRSSTSMRGTLQHGLDLSPTTQVSIDLASDDRYGPSNNRMRRKKGTELPQPDQEAGDDQQRTTGWSHVFGKGEDGIAVVTMDGTAIRSRGKGEPPVNVYEVEGSYEAVVAGAPYAGTTDDAINHASKHAHHQVLMMAVPAGSPDVLNNNRMISNRRLKGGTGVGFSATTHNYKELEVDHDFAKRATTRQAASCFSEARELWFHNQVYCAHSTCM